MASNKKEVGQTGEVKVVKVAPYPIACKFMTPDGVAPLEALIYRLEEFGFVFRAIGHLYRVGEDYICDFEIPVFKDQIHQSVKVIKTFESVEAYFTGKAKQKVMQVEVHFKNSGEYTKAIRQYLLKIGQEPAKPVRIK